jgi:hypothetical protein
MEMKGRMSIYREREMLFRDEQSALSCLLMDLSKYVDDLISFFRRYVHYLLVVSSKMRIKLVIFRANL